jgi:hypothetical protein
MATRKKIYGEWGYGPLPDNLSDYYPYYNGWHLITDWKTLEPTAGNYDFSSLEADMMRLKNAGFNIGLTMWVNPKSYLPAWLFRAPFSVPVPTVTTYISVTSYGYYLDSMDSYKTRLFAMIDALLDYLVSSPAEPNIIYVQSAEGHQNLVKPYIGVPDQVRFKITDAAWLAFQKEVWQHTYNKMQQTITIGGESGEINQFVDLIINAADSSTIRDYVISTLPNAWLRKSGEGQDYGANLEDYLYIDIVEEKANQLANPGVFRKRTDFAFISDQQWFKQAFRQNIMQVALTEVTKGNDIWNVNDVNDLSDIATHQTVSDLVSKLSGNQSPTGATKVAWWAANSKIDASDTTRFLSATYGSVLTSGADTSSVPDDYVKKANMNRLNKILKVYNPNLTNTITSCTLVPEQFGNNAQTDKRLEDHWKSDIGMKVRTEPLGAWLTEENYENSSTYFWRLGDPQNDYWGRYAVGFKSTAAPNNIKRWKLDTAFKAGLSAATVTLVYYDGGTTQWRVRNVTGSYVFIKTNTNSKTWKTVTFDINNFQSGKLANGNDISIEYTAGGLGVAFAYVDIIKKVVTINQPPVVDAGANQQITVNTATLTATAADGDGTIDSTLWTFISGPKIPTIASPNTLSTSVTGMSTTGDYIFEFSATDNLGAISTDPVTITRAVAVINPIANAGPSKTITLPTTTVTVGGTDTAGSFPIATRQWTIITKPTGAADPTFTAATSATTDVNGLNFVGTYTFRKTVSDNQTPAHTSIDDVDVIVNPNPVNLLPVVNAGPDQQITGTSATLTGTATDTDGVIVSTKWDWATYDQDGNPIYPVGATPVITSPTALTTTVTGMTVNGDYALALKAIDNNNGVSTDPVTITKTTTISKPTANAGPDVSITLPVNTATVGGADVAPSGFSIASRLWTVVSIPDGATNPTFGTATAATTTVNGLTVAGTYVLNKHVIDNQSTPQSDDDPVNITVYPKIQNSPPVVFAGDNQSITSATTATLTATATDSDGTIISQTWSVVSYPIMPVIASIHQLSTSISGMTLNGSYVFRFTATDNSGDSSFDEVTIIKGSGGAPVAKAGPNVSIVQPATQATIGATGDSAAAGFSIASILWTKFSGPGTPTIVTPTTATTLITGLSIPQGQTSAQWTYRKTVTDNQSPPQSGYNDMILTLSSNAPSATKFGAFIIGNNMNTDQKLAFAQNLTCDIIRTSVSLNPSAYNGAANQKFLAKIAGANKTCALVVNWTDTNGANFVTPGAELNAMSANLDNLLAYYGSAKNGGTIEFVVFENEPDNNNYYPQDAGNTANYITEIQTLIPVCHAHNIPCGDGCIHVQNAGANSGRVGAIKNAYAVEWANLDYINIHGYYPRDTATMWTSAVNAVNLKKLAAQKIISNECGIKEHNVDTIDGTQVTELVGILKSRNFAYAILTVGGAGGIAKPFNDCDICPVGEICCITLNGNGDAFVAAINV